jgi:carbon monoxide dehydrogenase subunit G
LHLEKKFDVKRERDAAVEIAAREETVVGLFPDAETEIVARAGDRCTARTKYRALGREGEATFHFTYLKGGDVRFEKVCDGRVWSKLEGSLSFEERGEKTRVRIEMDGRTKGLVPEFTIKGPMQEQLDQMAKALRRCLEAE